MAGVRSRKKRRPKVKRRREGEGADMDRLFDSGGERSPKFSKHNPLQIRGERPFIWGKDE